MKPLMSSNIFKKGAREGSVSVVIPVYRDEKGLRDTLESLGTQSLRRDRFEIIVGNDGGDAAISAACAAYGVRHIAVLPRQGSYGARNAALAESEGEFIAFVDADITVPSDWLEKGIALLANHDYVGGAVRFDPRALIHASHYYEAGVAFNNASRFARHHYAPTANLFVRRSLLEEIGAFDPRFESGGDAEFGNRVYLAGCYRMTFSDELYIHHPPRGYRALVRKVKRTTLGMRDKLRYYPERFGYLRMSPLRSFLIPFMPAWKLVKEGRLGTLRTVATLPIALWFGLVEYYYFVRVFYTGIKV